MSDDAQDDFGYPGAGAGWEHPYTARPATEEEAAPLKAEHAAKVKAEADKKVAGAASAMRSKELEESYSSRPGYVMAMIDPVGVTDWEEVHKDTSNTGWKQVYHEGTTPSGTTILRRTTPGGYDDGPRSSYWMTQAEARRASVAFATRYKEPMETMQENLAGRHPQEWCRHAMAEITENPNSSHVQEYHAVMAGQKP